MSDINANVTANELPIMENEVPFEPTPMTETEIKEKIARKVYAKLDYWELNPDMTEVRAIVDKWWDAKANIRAILRKHPKWNEEQQAVIFEENYDASTNTEDIKKFGEWCQNNLIYADYFKAKVAINGNGLNWRERDDALEKARIEGNPLFHAWDSRYLHKADYDNFNKASRFFEYGRAFTASVVDEDFVQEVTELGVSELIPPIGQKLSRSVRKIGSYYGLDKIVKIEPVYHNGVMQEKDKGWNYQFAMFGDAINPAHIKRFTAFSINLMDYITMSNGTSWSSCHFPDVNEVESDGSGCFDYCHASGGMSYALDNATVIFFTVSPDYVGEMCDAKKERRMNFHLAPDGKSFIFGRLYPDGRDGGETGLAAMFRRTVQKILAECLGVPNLWKFHKGTEGNRKHTSTQGTHYDDYNCYPDTGYSYLQDTEMPIIRIGHHPICPSCGMQHDNCNDLRCQRCGKGHYDAYCYWCDEGIDTDRDDYYYCEEDDRYFCSESCYRRAGYVQCDDYSIHSEDECCYDEWTEEWYYCDWSDGVSPDGETWYANEDHATSDGWIELKTPDGDYEWYREDDCEEDAYT